MIIIKTAHNIEQDNQEEMRHKTTGTDNGMNDKSSTEWIANFM